MVWIDIAILVIVGISVLISIIRGFVKEAMSLVVWLAAFWISLTFAGRLAVLFQKWIADPTIQRVAAYATLFVATLIIGAIVNYIIGQLVKKTGLSGTDRLIGMFFGLGRGVVIVSALLMIAGYTPLPKEPVWKESVLIGYVEPAVKAIIKVMPDEMVKYIKFEGVSESGDSKNSYSKDNSDKQTDNSNIIENVKKLVN